MNNLRLIILCLFVLLIGINKRLFCGNEHEIIGARAGGMGNCTGTFSDIWAVRNNQAGMADLKEIGVGIFFKNNYFVKELSYSAISAALPTDAGVFGIDFSNMGYDYFKEQNLGIAYGKKFGNKVAAGIKLDYLAYHMYEPYGTKNIFTFEGGIIGKLSSNMMISAHIFNPIQAKLNDYGDERLATVFNTGLSYKFSDKVIAIAEVEKRTNAKANIKAGIEYRPVKMIYLRTGVNTNPGTNSFGFGFVFDNLFVDLASTWHPVLGHSPQIGIHYIFAKNKKK